MTEVLLALVSVLNVAVGTLALQLRRNGKKQGGNNDALHEVVKLLNSIDVKMDKLDENQKRYADEAIIWHTEVRNSYKDITKELSNIQKRGET